MKNSNSRSSGFLCLLLLASSLALVDAARADNILTNPGFESDPGPSQNIVGWTRYGPNDYNETNSPARTGSNYFKVYQAFTGLVNSSGIYQDNISAPGVVFSANGWAYTLSTDKVAGQNAVWIEVTFRDAQTKILALYRSAVITTNTIATGKFPVNQWINLPTTNQYDPNTFAITNTTANLVAPAGTSFVRYQIVFQGDANNSNGSMYFDDLTLNRSQGAAMGNWNIVWSDEFNGAAIDTSVWAFDIGNGSGGWGNNELEYYTSSFQNAYVSGGLLNIVARQQSMGGRNYTSARMKTQGLFSKTYGRFEWRAKFPQGAGFWPALWMLGTNINSAGWPACGEIDVMENNGSSPTNVQGSIHSGSDATKVYTLPGSSVTNFHSYLLEWTPNAINWFVDGLLYESQTNWSSSLGAYPEPFDRPFFLIMNLAIGGNYLGNPSTNTINAGSAFPATMQVDYVRIYDQTSPLQISLTRSNSNVVLTWPTNIVCHLQAQTNINASGLTTNWFDLNTATSPYVTAPSSGVFYRLASP